MTFNAGKYEITSTNTEKTEWLVKSADGKEVFTHTGPVGTVANRCLKLTALAYLNK
jgi:hypothetical protein